MAQASAYPLAWAIVVSGVIPEEPLVLSFMVVANVQKVPASWALGGVGGSCALNDDSSTAVAVVGRMVWKLGGCCDVPVKDAGTALMDFG